MTTPVLTNLDFNQTQLLNAVTHNLAQAPENPVKGQHYFDTASNTEFVWNGSAWIDCLNQGKIYTYQNGVKELTGADAGKVEINIASGANAGNVTLTANANGLKAAVDEASTSAKGIIEIADATEIAAGTATDKAVTPKQLADGLSGKVDKLETKPTAGTFTKVTINAEGQVTGGASLQASDVPDLTLAKITDVTATASEVNVLDGITATTAELNILDGVTASASEINILDGATLTTTELNYVDGVTSSIQTQLDGKVAKLTTKPTAGTYPKVTINTEGQVTGGANLEASDIPDLSATYIAVTEKGANSGVAELDSSGTVPTAQLPDLSATYIAVTEKGANSGVAELDASGKVPADQLPSYVDDVVEILTAASTAPATCAKGDLYYNTDSKKIFKATAANTWSSIGEDPEKSKIYVTLDDDKSYRWGGSSMIVIGQPVAAASESAAGIIEIATTAEVAAGTDDTRAITPAKLKAVTNSIDTEVAKKTEKISAQNPALTASSGLCTWTQTNTIGSADCLVGVYRVSDNVQVIADVTVTASNIVVKFVSASNIAKDTYKLVAVGL